MALHDDLRIFFPKYNHAYQRSTTTISERDKKATVQKLIFSNSDFTVVDTLMINDYTSFFSIVSNSNTATHEIFFKDCDGIVLFENDGKKYFFLAELKSSFASQEIYKAMHQIISSYIKANMLMNLLATYNPNDYIFEAFIVCHPPKPDYMVNLHKTTLLPSTSRYKTEGEFSREFVINKKVDIKPTDCEKLKHFNLSNSCIFNRLTFHFIEVPNGKDSTSIDVKQYI